jgi:hypothetical protein
VILQNNARPVPQDFDKLEPSEEDLAVRSRLVDSAALDALAAFEEAERRGDDSILAAAGTISDFVSFIWFSLAATEERLGSAPATDPMNSLEATLGYSQMTDEQRARYRAAVSSISASYRSTIPSTRLRLARTGANVSTARALDSLAERISHSLTRTDASDPPLETYEAVLDLLEDFDAFDELLVLHDRPRNWEFHRTTSSRSPEFDVDPKTLMLQWVGGSSLTQIADHVFSEITDRSRRMEVAVDCVTDFCEHFFAWTIGVLLRLTNDHLSELAAPTIDTDLALYLRFGVNNDVSLRLRLSGVRSRELATRVSADAATAGVEARRLQSWLQGMTVGDWRILFQATTADITDLLNFCEDNEAGILSEVLSQGVGKVPIAPALLAPIAAAQVAEDGRPDVYTLRRIRPYQEILVSRLGGDDRMVDLPLRIPVAFHNEVSALMDGGLNLQVEIADDGLRIREIPD